MRRFLKWLIIAIASAIGVFLGLALVLVLVVLSRPGLLINDRTLIVGSHWLERNAGIHLSWEKGHVEVDSLALLEKRVRLDFGRLCVRMPSRGLDACFEEARIAAAGGLKAFKPRLSEIGPVLLKGGRVRYVVQEGQTEEAKPAKEEGKKGELIPEFLADVKIHPIEIEVPDWKVVSGETEIAGELDLDSRLDSQGRALIDLDSQARTKPGRQKAWVDLKLENPRGFMDPAGWELALNARGSLPDGTKARARVELDPQAHEGPMAYAYSIDAQYDKKPGSAKARVRGEITPDKLVSRFTGEASRLVPGVEQVWVRGCELKVERRGSETEPGALKADCPVMAKVPVPPQGFPPLAMPTRVGARVRADLRASAFPPGMDSQFAGRVGVELDPILTPLLEGGGKVESEIIGVPEKFPNDWKMDTNLGLRLKVTRFERLVERLANTPFDVWAPLRVLRGHVDLAVDGKFDANRGAAPVSLKTRLASPHQILNVDAVGRLALERMRPSPKMHLDLDVALTRVQLELPPLPRLPTPGDPTPDPMPRFFADSRIRVPIEKPDYQQAGRVERVPAFTYSIRIRTPDAARPIRFSTKQLKQPVPLTVSLALASDGPMSGQITVQSFPLQLFKRDVEFDHLTVSLRQPSKDSKLDGRIVVPYTDYTITILVLGTTDKPQVRFLSDPPLPDDQILAALVFGRPLESLDPDEQESVGNTRAALRQGALGLFSLYLFSSLNIEALDYDPDSKTASMRYRLGEGTSLNVSQGTGGGQPSVGVRKRLSKHLAITTTLNNPSPQQQDRTVSTFLEWAYQY